MKNYLAITLLALLCKWSSLSPKQFTPQTKLADKKTLGRRFICLQIVLTPIQVGDMFIGLNKHLLSPIIQRVKTDEKKSRETCSQKKVYQEKPFQFDPKPNGYLKVFPEFKLNFRCNLEFP